MKSFQEYGYGISKAEGAIDHPLDFPIPFIGSAIQTGEDMRTYLLSPIHVILVHVANNPQVPGIKDMFIYSIIDCKEVGDSIVVHFHSAVVWRENHFYAGMVSGLVETEVQ